MKSKIKVWREKKKYIKYHLGFEFGFLQEEVKMQFELQAVSTFSAAQRKDAGLKWGLIKP